MRRRSSLGLVLSACALFAVVGGIGVARGADDAVRVQVEAPAELDPARAGDAASSAVIAQLFETLTTFDDARQIRPALAASWDIAPDARRITFHLRPGLSFSDGSPLRASDVVRSWMRLIDPRAPSPLVNLMLDVAGAQEYLDGGSADSVGLHADDSAGTVAVDFARPSADFVDVVTSPTFAVVPPGLDADSLRPGRGFVGSGGYVLSDATDARMTLRANEHYWAGRPAIPEVTLVTDLAGGSPVEEFSGGSLDYTPITEADASWIGWDATLGPSLRQVPSLSTDYFGFDTSRPPFDDVRVRRAFAAAVDWRRIARLAQRDPAAVATSMVPPGIPGRSTKDLVPVHDVAAARTSLADAGYPGGTDFPTVTMLTGGTGYDDAIVTELHDALGVRIRAETMDFEAYYGRLASEPPQIWALSWIADYPGRNDFLGILLGSDSVNNYGRWRSAAFDDAIEEAKAETDPIAASAAFDRAETIVQHDAPVIPVSYGTGWALSRAGLLGAGQNGLGIPRLAGLAWAP